MTLASSLKNRSAQNRSTHSPSIPEWNDAFLALWPHRHDYLWAAHPNPGEKPHWQTESRYPLSDRRIQQGAYLHGVRFGPTTRYFVLDIDSGSLYHPSRDRLAWRRIVAALEPLGMVQPLTCTSSYSRGLHLYFPFEQDQKTWAIALAVTTLLENGGFKLAPGQLEVFPNCKPYSPTGEYSLYGGHRLPMQAGSYLLNDDLQMIWSDQDIFVQHWHFAQGRNSVEATTLNRIIKTAHRRPYRITGKADKFLNDLNTEIEQGWTGAGQTNRLLGRIAMRSYIFGHVLYADQPLEGDALVNDIVTQARSLPGYDDWCQHRHELEERAKGWVDSITKSHYFHYGTDKPKGTATLEQAQNHTNTEPTWNQQQQAEARQRIQQAIAHLLETETLPAGITQRFEALVNQGISGATLYRHRDLWHPHHLRQTPTPASIQPPRDGVENALQCDAVAECVESASATANHTNLLGGDGCNSAPDNGLGDRFTDHLLQTGCNNLPSQDLSPVEPKSMSQIEGIAFIHQVLNQIKAQQKEQREQKARRWQSE